MGSNAKGNNPLTGNEVSQEETKKPGEAAPPSRTVELLTEILKEIKENGRTLKSIRLLLEKEARAIQQVEAQQSESCIAKSRKTQDGAQREADKASESDNEDNEGGNNGEGTAQAGQRHQVSRYDEYRTTIKPTTPRGITFVNTSQGQERRGSYPDPRTRLNQRWEVDQ